MVKPFAQADQFRQGDAALARLLGEPAPLIKQWNLDVLDDGILRKKVVRLKNKAEVTAADLGKLVVVDVSDVFVIEEIMAARAAVEASEQIQERGLTRSGRPHERDEVAFLEVQGHSRHGGNDDFFHL